MTTFNEHMAERKALEEKLGGVIVREFEKVPPEEFQALLVEQANTFYCITSARFVERYLVAQHYQMKDQHGTSALNAMLDGITLGYKLALGPTKPYSLTYTHVTVKARTRDGVSLKGKTEEEVFKALGLEYGYDKLPDHIFTKKEVTETFATHDEAMARSKELQGEWPKRPFPEHEHKDYWKIKYDSSLQYHF